MKRPLAQFLIALAIVVTTTSAAAGAEAENSVNLGFGGIIHIMPHCDAKVYSGEFEHQVTQTTTMLGRISAVHYRFDSGQYFETGKPWGLDVGTRYYPSGAMQGFFVGGALGYWKAGWSFIQDERRPSTSWGQASSTSVRLNVEIGDRIRIGGSNFSIMPEVNLGKFFSSSSCHYTAPASRVGTQCLQPSEVDYYVYVGIVAGIAF